MFNTIYNQIKEIFTRKNRRELNRIAISIQKKGIDSKLTSSERELLKKIDNHIKRSYYESDITREKILQWLSKLFEDEIYEFLSQQFVKDATKQTASEKAQMKCMKEKGFEMLKLPASGKNSLRFDEKSKNLIPTKTEGVTSRSFDYKREYDGYIEFLTGKVTFGQGGAQNGMKDEIVNFLKRAKSYLQQNPNSNYVFTALVDGDSLTENDLLSYKQFTSEKIRLMSCDNYKKFVS